MDKIENSLENYKEQIKSCFKLNNDKIYPEFDLIHLGIGRDGHTASIFDFQNLNNNQILAITKGEKYQRITFTYKILNNARNILFLVTGKEKQEILAKIINSKNQYPAGQISNKGRLFYLLDSNSANNL